VSAGRREGERWRPCGAGGAGLAAAAAGSQSAWTSRVCRLNASAGGGVGAGPPSVGARLSGRSLACSAPASQCLLVSCDGMLDGMRVQSAVVSSSTYR